MERYQLLALNHPEFNKCTGPRKHGRNIRWLRRCYLSDIHASCRAPGEVRVDHSLVWTWVVAYCCKDMAIFRDFSSEMYIFIGRSRLGLIWHDFADVRDNWKNGNLTQTWTYNMRLKFWLKILSRREKFEENLKGVIFFRFTLYVYTPWGRKRNHFSFTNKSFNTQCNLTKFSTFIVNEYYRRCYLFNLWNLHQFRQVTVQKVWRRILRQ